MAKAKSDTMPIITGRIDLAIDIDQPTMGQLQYLMERFNIPANAKVMVDYRDVVFYWEEANA